MRVFELAQAFLNVVLSAEVKLNVYDEPVFDIALYGTSSLEPVNEMHASRAETAVNVACLGILARGTVNPLKSDENLE